MNCYLILANLNENWWWPYSLLVDSAFTSSLPTYMILIKLSEPTPIQHPFREFFKTWKNSRVKGQYV